MTGQPAPHPLTEAPPNRIGTLEFRFDLVDGPGPLGTPERLLLAIRAELLATVEHVLADSAHARADLRLETVEIDLGDFPDPPDWPAVRRRLAETLAAALAPHLGRPRPEPSRPAASAPIPGPSFPGTEGLRGPAPSATMPEPKPEPERVPASAPPTAPLADRPGAAPGAPTDPYALPVFRAASVPAAATRLTSGPAALPAQPDRHAAAPSLPADSAPRATPLPPTGAVAPEPPSVALSGTGLPETGSLGSTATIGHSPSSGNPAAAAPPAAVADPVSGPGTSSLSGPARPGPSAPEAARSLRNALESAPAPAAPSAARETPPLGPKPGADRTAGAPSDQTGSPGDTRPHPPGYGGTAVPAPPGLVVPRDLADRASSASADTAPVPMAQTAVPDDLSGTAPPAPQADPASDARTGPGLARAPSGAPARPASPAAPESETPTAIPQEAGVAHRMSVPDDTASARSLGDHPTAGVSALTDALSARAPSAVQTPPGPSSGRQTPDLPPTERPAHDRPDATARHGVPERHPASPQRSLQDDANRRDPTRPVAPAAGSSPERSIGDPAPPQTETAEGSAPGSGAQELGQARQPDRARTTGEARDLKGSALRQDPDEADGTGAGLKTATAAGAGQQTDTPAPTARSDPAALPREALGDERPNPADRSRQGHRPGGASASQTPSQSGLADAVSDAPTTPNDTASAASAKPGMVGRQRAARRLVPALGGESARLRPSPETLDRIAAQLRSAPPPETLAALASGGAAARAAAQALRQATIGRPGGADPILAGLAPDDIARLIAALLPKGAQALSEAVAALDRTARDPVSARRAVAQALLETRPVDLDAARALAPKDPGARALADLLALAGASPGRVTPAPALPGDGTPGAPGRDRAAQTGEAPDATRDAASPGQPAEDRSGASDNGAFAAPPAQTAPPERKADAPDAGPETLGSGPAAEGPPAATPKVGPQGLSDRAASKTGSADGGHAADRATPAAHAAQADPAGPRPGEPGEKPDAPVIGATTDPGPQPGEAAGDGTAPDAGILRAAARNLRDPKPTGSAEGSGRAAGNSPDKAALPGPRSADGGHTADRATPAAHAAQGDPAGPRPGEPGEKPDAPVTGATTDPGPQPGEADGDGTAPDAAPDAGILRAAARNLRDPKPTGSAEGSGRAAGNSPDKAALPGPRSADGGHTADRATPAAHAAQGDPAGPRPGEPGEQPDAPVTGATTGPDPQPGGSARAEPDKAAGDGTAPDTGILGAAARNRRDAKPTGSAEGSGRATGNGPDKGALPGPRSAEGGHAADRAIPAAHAAQADPTKQRPGEPGEKPDAPVTGATTDPAPQPGEAAGDGTTPDAGFLGAAARNRRDPKPTGSAKEAGRATGNSPDKAAPPGPQSDADVAARAGRSRGPEGNAPRQDAEGSPGADPATPSVGAARDGWSGHLLGHDARPLPETRGLAGRGDRPAPAGSAGHATAKERPSDAAQRRASGPPPERNGVPDPSRIEALAGRDLPEAPKGKPLDGPAGPSVPRTAETARPDPAADPGTGKTGQARADAENAARPGADGPADGPPDPARPSRAHTDAADAAPAATEAPGPADAPPETEAREAALAGLYEAALGDGASTVRGMLDQIAGALPVALTSPLDRDGLDAAKLAAALVAGPGPGAPGRAAEAFLQALSPDEAERVVLLRSLAARLGYAAPAPGPQGALRRTARAAVEDLLKAAAPAPAPARAAPPVGTASEAATHSLTERAGLVLFHPYLRMLFDRLGLIEARQIRADGLPRAAAVLAALAEAQPAQRLPDPLERLLLGMPEGARPEPCPTLAPAETALIDSLLRSVIGQWTRLGKTSPEGLRATFIRRRGLIGTDDRGAPRLTVAPGPFDMLLDGLPWALGPIRLPWMPEALSVIWRNADD